MLMWNEVIDESREIEKHTAAPKDDPKLIEIYLCRLFLTPGLGRVAVQNLPLRRFKEQTQQLLTALAEEQKQQTNGVIGKPIGFVQ
ncbi:MAG: hypothetical protein GYB26_00035 [Gammaproteobacteria bacterium]|nr:hypothetical protein [Gammaproteobacteria bacterium]